MFIYWSASCLYRHRAHGRCLEGYHICVYRRGCCRVGSSIRHIYQTSSGVSVVTELGHASATRRGQYFIRTYKGSSAAAVLTSQCVKASQYRSRLEYLAWCTAALSTRPTEQHSNAHGREDPRAALPGESLAQSEEGEAHQRKQGQKQATGTLFEWERQCAAGHMDRLRALDAGPTSNSDVGELRAARAVEALSAASSETQGFTRLVLAARVPRGWDRASPTASCVRHQRTGEHRTRKENRRRAGAIHTVASRGPDQ